MKGKVQVITTASRPEAGNRKTPGKVISYDLENGNVIWECSGLTDNAIPCPIVEGGVAYCMTGYQGFSLLAVPISGSGDQSENILWTGNSGTPYVPSPILYDGHLYFTQSNQAILSCVDAQTGKVLMERTRLPGLSNVYASLLEQVIIFTWWGATGKPPCSSGRGSSTWWLRTPWPIASMPRPRWQAINFSCVDINFSTVLVSK